SRTASMGLRRSTEAMPSRRPGGACSTNEATSSLLTRAPSGPYHALMSPTSTPPASMAATVSSTGTSFSGGFFPVHRHSESSISCWRKRTVPCCIHASITMVSSPGRPAAVLGDSAAQDDSESTYRPNAKRAPAAAPVRRAWAAGARGVRRSGLALGSALQRGLCGRGEGRQIAEPVAARGRVVGRLDRNRHRVEPVVAGAQLVPGELVADVGPGEPGSLRGLAGHSGEGVGGAVEGDALGVADARAPVDDRV